MAVNVGPGFEDFGSVPGPDDHAVMTILEREGVMLIVGALSGMPFPDSDRERQIQAGPRALRCRHRPGRR